LPGKRLNKTFPDNLLKGEVLDGYYDNESNTIFVSSDLTEEQQVHIFFHEMIHYMESVTHRLNEEGRCDTLGGYLATLMKVSNLEGFLDERKQKRSRKKG